MAKMIKCKTCGAEIAKTARRCPYCGAQQHVGALTACAIIIVATIFLIFLVIVGGGSETSGRNTQEEAQEFDSITKTLDNWKITVTGFEFVDNISTSWITEYKPEENSKYGIFYVSVVNEGTASDTFLPVLSLSDDVSCAVMVGPYTYTRSALLGYQQDLTNRRLNPLESADGIVAFAFPDSFSDSNVTFNLVFKKGQKTITFEIS